MISRLNFLLLGFILIPIDYSPICYDENAADRLLMHYKAFKANSYVCFRHLSQYDYLPVSINEMNP